MRPIGTPAELERRRTLAVERYLDGYSISEIGCFLGVDASSVRRWVACFRQRGIPGIIALDAIAENPEFLQSMWHASELPLPRALLL
jgi:transposase-like protein